MRFVIFAAWSWLSSTTDPHRSSQHKLPNHELAFTYCEQTPCIPIRRSAQLSSTHPQKRLVCSTQTPDEASAAACALLPSRVCISLNLRAEASRQSHWIMNHLFDQQLHTKHTHSFHHWIKNQIKVIVAFYLTISEKEVWMAKCKLGILRYIRILVQNCEILNLTNWNCKKSQNSQNCEK